MKNNSLTMTLVLETSSANFGEGFGNVSELKKITRNNGEVYTCISKQSLKKEMRTQMNLELAPVVYPGGKKEGSSGVAQFSPNAKIQDYAEIDLFGYMRTQEKQSADTRLAVVRVSDAISLEPFAFDTDYLTNGFMAQRAGGFPNPVSIENHKSFYSYTITIDLDRVGVLNGESMITEEEKVNRIIALLEAVQYLYKDVRGDRKSLAPIFIVGGVYNKKSPFFLDTVTVLKNEIVYGNILDVFENEYIKENSLIGVQSGRFLNGKEIVEDLKAVSVNKFFEVLKGKIVENFK